MQRVKRTGRFGDVRTERKKFQREEGKVTVVYLPELYKLYMATFQCTICFLFTTCFSYLSSTSLSRLQTKIEQLIFCLIVYDPETSMSSMVAAKRHLFLRGIKKASRKKWHKMFPQYFCPPFKHQSVEPG